METQSAVNVPAYQLFGRLGIDVITNFTGTISGVVEYMTGCRQILIQPIMSAEKTEWREARWFDETRVTFGDVNKGYQYILKLKLKNVEPYQDTNGADIPAPVK